MQSGPHEYAGQKGGATVKFSRAALGNNPLQNSLIDSAEMPIFGLPVSSHEAARLSGQQERIESLMSDGYWHTIPELQRTLKSKYGQLYSETSISARLRAMRKRGYTVSTERTRAGSNLYQYRAVKGHAHVENVQAPPASTLSTSPTPCTPERAEAIHAALNCTCHIDPLGRCAVHLSEADAVDGDEPGNIDLEMTPWAFDAAVRENAETHTEESAMMAHAEAAL
jgi:hypothetical protein